MKLFYSLICAGLVIFPLRVHSATTNGQSAQVTAPDLKTEGNVARLVTSLMTQAHYSRHPLNEEISSRFLDHYFDMLDGSRFHFFQSDVAEFDTYRSKLADLSKTADVRPAHLIFARFLERVEQHVAYVDQLLKEDHFQFTNDERYVFNRKDAPRPKNLDEAKALWAKALRFEYLGEKLAQETKITKKTNGTGSVTVISGTKTNIVSAEHVDETVKSMASTNSIPEILAKRYQRILRTWKELGAEDVFELYLTSFTHAYDPHSDYFGPSTAEDFEIAMKLSLFGIGAELRSEDGYCEISRLVEGGPAEASKKLEAKDRIVAVAQGDGEPVDVVGMRLTRVVKLIRGEKGTRVVLTVIPGNTTDSSARKTVSIIRDEIKLADKEAKARLIEYPTPAKTLKLGVIDLPSFYEDFNMNGETIGDRKSTTVDVKKLLDRLVRENVDGVVLDLRHNGGGSLSEAIRLTGLFIHEGPVVQTRGGEGNIEVDKDPDPSIEYSGPLIVLTSRLSASASEILAGALQDYGRALIVGDISTHGKGTVQQLLPLQSLMQQNSLAFKFDPGQLKFTIRKFYRPSGDSTQKRGVISDIVLPSKLNFADIGESSLENPLEYDEIAPAQFEKVNQVQPFLADLSRLSLNRISTNKDFVYLREDIEQFKKLQADKSMSLNEKQRLKEKKDEDDRLERIKQERKARKSPDLKTYDVTLKTFQAAKLPVYSKTNDTARTFAPDADEEEGADKVADADITLEETERILVDYIRLATKAPDTLSVRSPQ